MFKEELDLTVEDMRTIMEYMRPGEPTKPVTLDMRELKKGFITSSRLVSLTIILKMKAKQA